MRPQFSRRENPSLTPSVEGVVSSFIKWAGCLFFSALLCCFEGFTALDFFQAFSCFHMLHLAWSILAGVVFGSLFLPPGLNVPTKVSFSPSGLG